MDLVRFGGSCPHCFNEIPGEEAPTDPGIPIVQEAEVSFEEEAGASSLNVRLLALIVAVFGGATYVGWVNMPEDVLESVAMMEEEFFVVPVGELEHGEDEEADEPGPVVEDLAVAPVVTGPPAVASQAADDGVADVAEAEERSEPPPVAPKHDQAGLVPRVGPGDDPPLVGPSLTGARLADPTMIQAMVREVISRYMPQMKACYERQLKSAPDLRGTWYLSFTIRKSGSVANISIRGVGTHHPELESCMATRVSDWKFRPLAEAMNIQSYPFRFGGF